MVRKADKFFILALVLCTYQVEASYNAAVVEFSPDGIEGPLVPPLILATNLDRYEQFVKQAKQQNNADIIVFPEYGLTTTWPSNNRSLAFEFSQYVPERKDETNPCLADNRTFAHEAVRRLSCMARDNGIHLVANLIERVDKDGELLLHNTNIAFDNTGLVLARYRKFNLFGEFALNGTSVADISVFDAFGARFGMITCFDIMFQHPSVTLVQVYGVTDIVFPTAWIQELPFLTAPQAQAAWSYGFGANLLAAGHNNPGRGMTGSGIYQGHNMGSMVSTSEVDYTSKLLVATVGSDDGGEILDATEGDNNAEIYHEKEMILTEDKLEKYTAVPVPKNTLDGSMLECNNGFCCNMTFTIAKKDALNFHYQLLVFDGKRTHKEGRYETEMQVCALVACADDTKLSCTKHFIESLYSLTTDFEYVKIEAQFKSNLLWRNTLDSGTMQAMDPSNYNFKIDATNYASMELMQPTTSIHTFGIYSHDYVL